MTAKEELHRILAKNYSLEDLASEVEAIAGSVAVLATIVEPIHGKDESISKDTIDGGFDSIVHHLERVSDTLNALQRLVFEYNRKETKQKET